MSQARSGHWQHHEVRKPPTTTCYGTVVYYRKKHEFTILDLSRIAFKIHAPDDPSKLPGFYAGVMAVITSLVGHLFSDLYFRVGVDPLGALINFWVSLLVSFYNAFMKWGGLAAFLNSLLSLLQGYDKED